MDFKHKTCYHNLNDQGPKLKLNQSIIPQTTSENGRKTKFWKQKHRLFTHVRYNRDTREILISTMNGKKLVLHSPVI